MLTGCFGIFGDKKPDPDIVIKTRTVIIAPPDSLIAGCDVVKPFSKDEYLSATIKDREKLLTNYAIKQNGELRKCNDSFVNIKEWRDNVIKVYKNEKDLEIKNK